MPLWFPHIFIQRTLHTYLLSMRIYFTYQRVNFVELVVIYKDENLELFLSQSLFEKVSLKEFKLFGIESIFNFIVRLTLMF